MITAAKVFNESRIIVYGKKGFMYNFKTYFIVVVVVVGNGTQEGTHCIYDTVFFSFRVVSFTRMSLPDLELPSSFPITECNSYNCRLQTCARGMTHTLPALHLPLGGPPTPPVQGLQKTVKLGNATHNYLKKSFNMN